jgi:hypothetical protein
MYRPASFQFSNENTLALREAGEMIKTIERWNGVSVPAAPAGDKT